MFKTLLLTSLLPCLSGGLIQNEPNMLSKDDNELTITLNAEEVTSEFQHFYDGYLSTDGNPVDIWFTYDDIAYLYDEVSDGMLIYADDEGLNYNIQFVYDNSFYDDLLIYHFYFMDINNVDSEPQLLLEELTVNFNSLDVDEELFNEVYSLIAMDLNPQPPYTNILQEIISILVSGITGIATGLGNGVSQLVSSIFITEGNLSVFGGVIFVFAGLGLAVGLSRWVMNYLTSLGKKD